MKMKAYASFDDWKNDQSAKNVELIELLEQLIAEVEPKLETTVKWGQGCWLLGNTPKVFIHTEDDHIQLGFYNGSALADRHHLLQGNGQYVRHVKVMTPSDIDREAFTDLILEALK